MEILEISDQTYPREVISCIPTISTFLANMLNVCIQKLFTCFICKDIPESDDV